MSRTFQHRVVIQPGGIVEINDPELPAGATADVTLTLNDAADDLPPLTSFIGACRGVYGSNAEEVDRYIRELRDEWDR